MRDPTPRTLWDQLCQAVKEWVDEEEPSAADPALLFHLALSVPLAIGLLVALRHL